jgi:hypothetical protein
MLSCERFFDAYRQTWGKLTLGQVAGLRWLLDELDRHGLGVRHMAYMLATVKHECGDRWQPIEEWGRGKGRPYGKVSSDTGKAYYGRGYVQLTWRRNYASAQEKLKAHGIHVDLVREPERALEREVATAILIHGMSEGWFTGRRLTDYIMGERCDYVQARKIINALDKADLIASHARKFERFLRMAQEDDHATEEGQVAEGDRA